MKKPSEMTAAEMIHSLPERFKADQTPENYNTRMHFELEGSDGGEFTVVANNETCTVIDGLEGEPDCTIKSKAKTYKKLELDEINPAMAVMMQKIKISDLSVALAFINMFKRFNKDEA